MKWKPIYQVQAELVLRKLLKESLTSADELIKLSLKSSIFNRIYEETVKLTHSTDTYERWGFKGDEYRAALLICCIQS